MKDEKVFSVGAVGLDMFGSLITGIYNISVCWGLEIELGSRMTAKAGDLCVAGTEILFGD